MPKAHLYHATQYRFWMARMVFENITLYGSGATPADAYFDLTHRPRVSVNR